jgi:hypothetical protein
MERGYVKLWRKALDSGLLQNGPAWQLFGYLLLKAAHKGYVATMGKVSCDVKPGESVFGRLRAAKDLNLGEQQIRTALKTLEKMKILTSKSTNKFTVVSFVNWEVYQCEADKANQQINQQATNKQPAANHIQECKNNTKTESKDSVVDATASTPDQQVLPVEESKKPRAKSSAPLCPHQQILALYHEVLPELPCMKIWDADRQKNLTARWRERWKAGKFMTQQEGVAYFRRLFAYIGRDCDWLMGRVVGQNGKPFFSSLDWIVLPRNFAKIIENKYDRREAA